MRRSAINMLRFLSGATAACITTTALAQSNSGPDGFVLDEITVTATKRPVGLQDVPIALSVVTGEKVEAMGMADLEDLVLYVPNVHIGKGAVTSLLFIRGVGSGMNPGFEQSVGTFVDGVYFGRGAYSRAPFLDLERVEVLKGPQLTLFGKNTIAGAINITTAQPTEAFEGYVEAAFESEVEGTSVSAMLSGPLSDTVRVRVAARMSDDEGWMTNTAVGGVGGPAEDNLAIRGTLDWDVTESLVFTLKAERSRYDVRGREQMISIANPTATFLYQTFGDAAFSPGFDYVRNVRTSVQPEFHDIEASMVQLAALYDWGDLAVTSITAVTGYDYRDSGDGDYSALQFLERSRIEEHEQFSQEFLLTSPGGDIVDFLAGVYFQTADLTSDQITPVRFTGLPPVDAGVRAQIDAALGTNLQAGDIDADLFGFFDQDTTTISAFGEFTFNLRNDLRILTGLRYSKDEKEVSRSRFQSPVGNATPDPFLAVVYGPILQIAGTYAYALERDENHLTGNIGLQWDPNTDSMLYLDISSGYKAGGFDEDNALGSLANAEFEDETVLGVEAGGKFTVLGGRGRINAALFHSKYEDLQVSTFDGNASFVVGNAAESVVTGLETDWTFAITEHLILSGALALLNAEYDSFPDSACTSTQFIAWIAAGNPRATCTQDLSGRQLQFAPDWAANIAARYMRPIGNDLELGLSVDINASDDTVIAADGDTLLAQKAYGKINARVSLGTSDGKWSIAVVGKNLGDEATTTFGNDVPLGSLGFDGTYFQHIDPPRTITLQGRWSF
ncbi:MAG: TonB-dependent receptor [Gammaproteobacteria bacterium]|nr:TonB-dependent receptor [Gammaproteobacteria bacterium]